jgi:hypothetical protein
MCFRFGVRFRASGRLPSMTHPAIWEAPPFAPSRDPWEAPPFALTRDPAPAPLPSHLLARSPAAALPGLDGQPAAPAAARAGSGAHRVRPALCPHRPAGGSGGGLGVTRAGAGAGTLGALGVLALSALHPHTPPWTGLNLWGKQAGARTRANIGERGGERGRRGEGEKDKGRRDKRTRGKAETEAFLWTTMSL